MKPPCIDPETLAAFAEGRLKRSEIAPLLDHLRECERCTHALEAAVEIHHEESGTTSRVPWWIATAAAVLVAVIAAPLLLSRWHRDGVTRLAALAPRESRLVEPRLSGGFGWAAYHGPERSNDRTPDADSLKLSGAAGDLIDRANRDRSAAAQHDAGVALVLIADPLRGVERLKSAADAAPRDAHVWNDLAAARYAAAERLGRTSLYPEALTALDRALAIEPRNAEALFNRALVLEKLGLVPQAREAWQRYLAVDPSSDWANEARERLAQLPAASGESEFRGERPRLEHAAESGDVASVAALVARFPQQCRTWGEAEYLGRWGEAVQHGDAAEAKRQLTIARALGNALAAFRGETLLRDAVQTIDASSDARALAGAHVTYRAARIVYSGQEPARAEPELRRAASLFAETRSPMALVARYFAANTRFDQNDSAGAQRELEPLLHEADARRYAALGAQVR
ncbi:MAG TPA: tetratricopeptide repeat protein, partial [Thermoanaerobaculia bacterium]|nr:tetratricopeptide repeat protein [Thermoanaerobaculia bacterium]